MRLLTRRLRSYWGRQESPPGRIHGGAPAAGHRTKRRGTQGAEATDPGAEAKEARAGGAEREQR